MANDLSKNFSRREFACRCGCGFNAVDYELIYVLEFLRFYFNVAIIVNCGARCEKHNKSKEVGGQPNSQHLIGKAADIKIKGFQPLAIYELLCQIFPNKYGIGLYDKFIHIDVRSGAARWNNSSYSPSPS